ncbi:hypothetical protein C0J52_27878 [Blattella germanica]|nr:hypothetical protein C0J52_27878 [Blattella germanica]
MSKENEKINNASRRSFLKTAALTGAAFCTSPILEKVNAAQKLTGQSLPSVANGKFSLPIITNYRTLGTGKFAMKVSTLGFGCMGLNYHRSQHPNKQAAINLVHEAIERGINLFDTAESYGPYTNETLVGEALKGYRDRVFVTTKFGHKFVNGKRVMTEEDSSPANIRKVCEESLRRLGIETIDLFYQHRADPHTPIEEVAETVKELIKEGKVKRFGLCEVNVDTIRRAHAIQPITAIQSEYHLMFRRVEDSILNLCEELGIGFVPYSPLNRGFLSGALNEYTRFDTTNDNRAALPRFTHEAMRANLRIVDVLYDFGRTRGITPAQLAQAWLMNKKPWIVPITGTTKLSHLEENIRSTDILFTAEEMNEIETRTAAIPIVGDRYNAAEQSKVQ